MCVCCKRSGGTCVCIVVKVCVCVCVCVCVSEREREIERERQRHRERERERERERKLTSTPHLINGLQTGRLSAARYPLVLPQFLNVLQHKSNSGRDFALCYDVLDPAKVAVYPDLERD